MPPDGWNKYQELVLHELRELRDDHAATSKEITQTRIEVEKLKVKSGVWGAIAGLVASVGVALVAVFR